MDCWWHWVPIFGYMFFKFRDQKPPKIGGTDGNFTTDEIEGHLRRTLVSSFTSTVGQAKIPALDLAGNYEAIADKCQEKMDEEFQKRLLDLAKGDRIAYFTVGHGELNWKTQSELPERAL